MDEKYERSDSGNSNQTPGKDPVTARVDVRLIRHAQVMFAVAAFLALFGAIYEHFSHGVYSYFMIYAFLVPLFLGALPYTALAIKKYPLSPLFINLWNPAVATLTVGVLFKGVLEIYGTTNRLLVVYFIVGGALGLSAVAAQVTIACRQRRQRPTAQ